MRSMDQSHDPEKLLATCGHVINNINKKIQLSTDQPHPYLQWPHGVGSKQTGQPISMHIGESALDNATQSGSDSPDGECEEL